MRTVSLLLSAALLSAPSVAAAAKKKSQASKGSVVELATNKGKIKIKLFARKAPKTVANFLKYVKSGHYDGTIFHRVIPNFMIQGGGFTVKLKKKPTRGPIKNEADNGLKNKRGTIAMARTPNPHSASAQFFINVKDNAFLDFKSKTPRGWGYTVFGKVVGGMKVVDAIKSVPTKRAGMHANLPVKPVVIKKARVVK